MNITMSSKNAKWVSIILIIIGLLFCVRWSNVWIYSISVFGLIPNLKVFQFWIDFLLFIIPSLIGFRFTKIFYMENHSIPKDKELNLSISIILWYVYMALKVIAAILSVVTLVSNLIDYGFGWAILYKMNTPLIINVLAESIWNIVLLVIPRDDLLLEEERTSSSYMKIIRRINKDTENTRRENNEAKN